MTHHDKDVDSITERFQYLDARLRQRTVLYTTLIIVLGVIVIGTAWWYVARAQTAMQQAEDQITALDERKRELEEETEELRRSKARLDEEIASREALLRRYEERLPEASQREVEVIQQGLDYGKRGDYRQAIAKYEAALEQDPNNSVTRNLLGYAHFQMGNSDEAIAFYRSAVELDPDFADAYYNLARAMWETGRRDQAAEALRTAVDLKPELRSRAHRDPAYAPIWKHLEVSAGQRKASTDEEQRFIKLGVTAAQNNELEAAVESYDRALGINPENAAVYNWRGYALYRMGRYDEAIASLHNAIRLGPEVAEHHYNLAIALCAAGDPQGAVTEMRAAFELDAEWRVLARQDANSRCVLEAMRRQAG